MKKIICDFCNKQTLHATEYTLPCMCPIEVKTHGIVVAKMGYEIGEEKKDVCPECKEKIASLLELVPKIKIEGDNRDTIRMKAVKEKKEKKDKK